MKLQKLIIATTFISASSALLAIDGVSSYSRNYNVSYKGISVGQGTLSVNASPLSGDQWQYSISVSAKSSGLAKMVGGEMRINDTAKGLWESGIWYPTEFSHQQKDDKGTSSQQFFFNWQQNTLTENKDGHIKTFNLKQNTLDYGTTFLALQSMASRGCVSESYNQLIKNKIQPLTISCTGEKKVSGMQTYQFSASSGNQGFTAWMNKNAPYEMVKFSAIKDGKTTVTLSR